MKKYKILVLSDLNTNAASTIKSAVSLAKMIAGDIEVFSVKKPTDIIDKENQLSAIRTINAQQTKTVKKMQNLIDPIAAAYEVAIRHSFAFGNIKHEIKHFIENHQPDIIVIGKRKSTLFNFIGDGITPFVFNIFKGPIMIATDKKVLEPNKEISLGTLNNLDLSIDLKFAEDLMVHAQKPLKSFKIVKNSSRGASEAVMKPANKETVEYVFEHSDSSVKNLSNYLSKNNVDLLYLDRINENNDNTIDLMLSDINKLDVNLLVSAE